MPMGTVSCADLQVIDWLPGYTCPCKDDVAVFRFLVSANTSLDSSLSQLLNLDELRRAQRYHRKEDMRLFLYTRSLLRIICGNYINQLPAEVEFTLGEANKPELSGNTGWHINVSHTGSWILLAIGRVSVGIDIEKINPAFRFQDLLTTSFSSQERFSINAHADAQQRFYQLWTRKEALLKATGKGMDDDFGQVPSLDGLHIVDSGLIGGAGNWLVRSFAVADEYPASVSYQEMETAPTFYTLDNVLSRLST